MGKRYKPVPTRARRSEWASRPCRGCGTTVERRVSEMRDSVWCSRQCFHKNGRAERSVGGRPRSAETLIVQTSAGPKTAVVSPDGYVLIYWTTHPSANKGGRIPQHRAVMEEYLGRRLLPGENVHHRNGDRRDNRIENLELWVRAQPAGQRVEDVVAHATEMLARYAPDRLAFAGKT